MWNNRARNPCAKAAPTDCVAPAPNCWQWMASGTRKYLWQSRGWGETKLASDLDKNEDELQLTSANGVVTVSLFLSSWEDADEQNLRWFTIILTEAVTIKTVNSATVIVILWTLVLICVLKKKGHSLSFKPWFVCFLTRWRNGLRESDEEVKWFFFSSHKWQESFELKVCQECYCYEKSDV